MKTSFLIIGIGFLIFGLGNFFQYVPILITLVNQPFPFEHLSNVVSIEGKGISTQIGYLPINEAQNDPYWLFWSLILYLGVGIILFTIWRKRK